MAVAEPKLSGFRPGGLATPARPSAVAALVAASIAGHDGAAFGAQGGVGDGRGEGQRLLRVGFGGTQVIPDPVPSAGLLTLAPRHAV